MTEIVPRRRDRRTHKSKNHTCPNVDETALRDTTDGQHLRTGIDRDYCCSIHSFVIYILLFNYYVIFY